MVLCSVGDFYGGGDAYNEPKSRFVAEMMGYFGYDAIAVGEKDLLYGLATLVEDRDKFDLNLICANLFEKQEEKGKGKERPLKLKRPFPAYRIVKRGDLEIGLIGLLSPAVKVGPKAAQRSEVEALTYIIKDPAPIAMELIPEVRKKCDVLVILAHMERNELEQLLPDLPEVDFAVLGHSTKVVKTDEPFLVGTVPVYMATDRGQYIGRLHVTIDPEGKVADARNKVYFLDAIYPDEPVVAELVKAFEEDFRTIQKELYAKEMLRRSKGASGAGGIYLGAGACLRCHEEAFETYTRTRHARAYETLSTNFRQLDSNCIGCHSVGYGKPGGFTGVRVVGSMVDLVDVQCEACHGPGAEHSRDGAYLQSAVESCKTCHTEDQDASFNYAEAWEKIAH